MAPHSKEQLLLVASALIAALLPVSAASSQTIIRMPPVPAFSPSDSVTGPSTLSFFVASDTHFGWDPVIQPVCNSSYNSYELNRIAVDEMNHVPGVVDWPPDMGGGHVGEPEGVVVSGDIVDRGPEAVGYAQWVNFTRLFGLSGEGRLRYPVYEGFGNHDGGNLTSGKHYPNYVR
mmetsp:Transcript_10498/g.29874  ORF Transcript_10498/g.29874 Transcript_10498/m.29874 type:complete len:175 (-) Transcript_10498:11-535(-)